MDEKKILDMIKKSGENVDAPEEIHPEQIRRLLEEQPVDKKSRFRRYAQWGAVAAPPAPSTTILCFAIPHPLSRQAITKPSPSVI